MLIITYETNRGAVKSVAGEVVERPHHRLNNNQWRIRDSKGRDFWARENGQVSNGVRRLGYTISVELAP